MRAGLRPQKIDMQNTRPGKCKGREDRVAEDRDSEFRIQNSEETEFSDDSDGSKQYANNTKTADDVTARRAAAVVAKRRATIGRAADPITAADHAEGAGVGANWIDTA